MANLSFRSAARTANLTFSATSLAATAPSGVTENDAVLAFVYDYAVSPGTPATVTAVPSGFVQVGSDQVISLSTVNARVTVWTKLAGGSEPATYTFEFSGAAGIQIIMAAYDNPPTSGAIGQAFGTITVASGTTATGSGVTTDKTHQKLLYVSGNGVASTSTAPSGMTERYDANNNTIADEDRATAGATGDRSGTWSASGEHATFLLALYSEDSATPSTGATGRLAFVVSITPRPRTVVVQERPRTVTVLARPRTVSVRPRGE